jgi:hypothetical protein
LLDLNFSAKDPNNKGKWEDIEGLQFAVKELKKFYQKERRMPQTGEMLNEKLRGPINKGKWKQFGIRNWRDLMKYYVSNQS